MITTKINNTENLTIAHKIKILTDILKLRLSLLVAFSAAFGYVFALGRNIQWADLLGLALGGFLTTGCAIIINQIIEKDIDAQMQRTKDRPLPTDKISISEAVTLACIVGFSGFLFLAITTNWLTVALAFLSVVLYSFVYTPLKKVGSIAVFMGAIPGALPPVLGWVAATNQLWSYEALAIFGVQFLWQFPHFWAIAWVLNDDYKKVGFKLLPANSNKTVAWHIFFYTIALFGVSLMPFVLGYTGVFSTIVIIICNFLFLFTTVKLLQERSKKVATYTMFASFLYLPIVQIMYLIDRL